VDNDPAGPPAPRQATGTRRKFLRHIGLGGTGVTALIGLTEAAGLPPASAAAKRAPRGGRPAKGKSVRDVRARANGPGTATGCGTMALKCSPGQCNGPCPSGPWCFNFYGLSAWPWSCSASCVRSRRTCRARRGGRRSGWAQAGHPGPGLHRP
jgi:hypothetical protein